MSDRKKKFFNRKKQFYIEAFGVVVFSIVVFFISIDVDLFEEIYNFSRDHEEWEIDELFSLFFIASIALAVILYRNLKYLKIENELRIQAESEVRRMAFYDSLTGLPNRDLFIKRFEDMIKKTDQRVTIAVLFVDLDGFKQVNDSFGHYVGDELLIGMSGRLSQCLRTGDTVARIAGDEFVVIAKTSGGNNGILGLAERIIFELQTPFKINNQEIYVSASVGISLYPSDGNDGEELIKNADAAMYYAKNKGKNQFRFFSSEIYQEMQIKATIKKRLHQAIANDELYLMYQPIVDIPTGDIIGVETLLRWNNDEVGSISPTVFIPIAEEMGIITELGEWVFKKACIQAKKWKTIGFENFRVSINVSARQLNVDGFVKKIASLLNETGVSPHCIELELTESTIMYDVDSSIEALVELENMGILLAIDDFGTGYSSISYLRKLKLHRLKIDQSFVRNIPHNNEDVVIVNTIISLARSLNLKITVEGIETKEQYEYFKKMSCDSGQGFLFGKPMAPEDIEKLV